MDAGKVPIELQDLLADLAIQWEAYDKRKGRRHLGTIKAED
jgi:hypothetical protein